MLNLNNSDCEYKTKENYDEKNIDNIIREKDKFVNNITNRQIEKIPELKEKIISVWREETMTKIETDIYNYIHIPDKEYLLALIEFHLDVGCFELKSYLQKNIEILDDSYIHIKKI